MDSDYSESDLTETDDDEYGSSSKKKGKSNSNDYRIRNALKVPRATTYTAQALYGKSSCFTIRVLRVLMKRMHLLDQMVSGDINLEPEYQRGRFYQDNMAEKLTAIIHFRCGLA